MRSPPWSHKHKPAVPKLSAALPAVLCHARRLSAEYPDTRTVPSPLSLRDISPHCGESPSDSNSIFPALAPSKSATRKIRFLRWGRFPHGVGEMSALADKGGRHGSCTPVLCIKNSPCEGIGFCQNLSGFCPFSRRSRN